MARSHLETVEIQKKTNKKLESFVSSPGGYSWQFLVGVCRLVVQILILFQTKKCNFPHPFSDLAIKQKLCCRYLD